MKIVSLSVLLLALSFSLAAQNFRITSSEEFKIKEKNKKNEVISYTVSFKGKLYSLYMNKTTGAGKWLFTKTFDIKNALELSKYDINMNELAQMKLEKGDKNFANVDPLLFPFDNQLLAGYFKPFKKEAYEFFISPIDTNTLQTGAETKLFSIPIKNAGILKASEMVGYIPVKYSLTQDKQHLVMSAVTPDNVVMITVVDKSLNVVKQDEIRIEEKGEYIQGNVLLTANGTVIIPINNDQNDRKLLVIEPDGRKKLTDLNNLVPGRYPYPLQAQLSKDGKTVWLYAVVNKNKGDNFYCHGMVLAAWDIAQQKLVRTYSYPFTDELMTALIGKGAVKSAGLLYVYKYEPQLVELDNGELMLIGSPEIHRTQTSMGSNNRTNFSNLYEVGAIVTLSVNKETGVFKPSFIPRYIYLSMSGGASAPYARIHIVPKSNSVALVYVDFEKNLKQPLTSPLYWANNAKDLVLGEAEVSSDGTVLSRRQLGVNQSGYYSYYMSFAVTEPGENFLLIPVGRQGVNFSGGTDSFSYWYKVEPVK